MFGRKKRMTQEDIEVSLARLCGCGFITNADEYGQIRQMMLKEEKTKETSRPCWIPLIISTVSLLLILLKEFLVKMT